jgi:hypothetical protein
MVLEIPGAIMEFGVLQGRHLALFAKLRELYEPHNVHREIIGFDTFNGFEGVTEIDQGHLADYPDKFECPPSYADHLREALDARTGDGSGKSSVQLVFGDVSKTLPNFQEPTNTLS